MYSFLPKSFSWTESSSRLKKFAKEYIYSEPAAANVFINGMEKGATPLTVKLRPGKQEKKHQRLFRKENNLIRNVAFFYDARLGKECKTVLKQRFNECRICF